MSESGGGGEGRMKVESGGVCRFDGLPIGKENMDGMVGGLAV